MKSKHTYDSALAALNEIVSDIENNKVSIDALSKKVEEATQLISFCKSHLTKTEQEVSKVLHKLNENEA